MQKSTLAYVLAALMLSTAAIYFVAAAQESSEAGEGQDSEQEAATSNSPDANNEQSSVNSAAKEEEDSKESSEAEEEAEGGDAVATQVEIAFFTIAGVAYAGVGAWIIKNKGKTNTPYLIAIGGSMAIIGLYVASRTIDMPIVGLQEDIGTIDILSKVLQVAIIGLSAYMININRVVRPIPNR
jgi:mannitol-specific phosphotransferase system IIBC component